MKNNLRKAVEKISAITLIAVTALTASFSGIHAAETKTATLNNAQISFNGGAVQTVQTYLVDDYNYIRARDISNGVNLEIRAIYNDDGYTLPGITIVPTSTATDTSPLETITQQTAQVTMQTCQINFGGYGVETEAFYLNDRYYFKLQDIAEASKKYEAMGESHYQQLLATDVSDLVLPLTINDGVRINVEWNDAAKTVSVNLVVTDYKAKLLEAKRLSDSVGNNGNNTSNNNGADTTTTVSDPTTTPTGALTPAPEVGTQLAKILIDESKGAYNADGTINTSNLTEAYKESWTKTTMIDGVNHTHTYITSIGGCNWYAYGRFNEMTGIDKSAVYDAVEFLLGDTSKTFSSDVKIVTDLKDITAPAIAVRSGHVNFIDYVEYDSSGNAETVYYSEANTAGANSIYRAGVDCVIKMIGAGYFTSSNYVLGYIVPAN